MRGKSARPRVGEANYTAPSHAIATGRRAARTCAVTRTFTPARSVFTCFFNRCCTGFFTRRCDGYVYSVWRRVTITVEGEGIVAIPSSNPWTVGLASFDNISRCGLAVPDLLHLFLVSRRDRTGGHIPVGTDVFLGERYSKSAGPLDHVRGACLFCSGGPAQL